MKLGVIITALVGLALVAWLVEFVGFAPVVAAVRAVGWLGFAVFCGYWLLVLAVLGAAWFTLSPGVPADKLGSVIWARTLREAASDILPFSQLGGLIIGARALIARGVGEATVFASLIVDLTVELGAQILYILIALSVLAWRLSDGASDHGVLWVGGGSAVVGCAAMAAFIFMQKRGVAVMGWLAGHWLPDSITRAAAVMAELDAIYLRRDRLLLGLAIHATAWVGGGFASWIALHFSHVDAPIWKVLTLEGLIFGVRSFAFFVPGGIGVQEASYALIGPLLGLHAPDVLALSLLKRGRDLVIGVPVLIAWRVLEGADLLRANSQSPEASPPPQ